jgi:Aldehyde dehydrogenase family
MSVAGECMAHSSASNTLVATVLERVDPTVLVVTSLLAMVLLTVMIVDKYHLVYHAKLWLEYLTTSVPTITVPMTDAEAQDDGVKGEPVKTMQLVDPNDKTKLNCYDPSTKQLLGQAKNMSAKEVEEILIKAKEAQEEWKTTTFAQRRMVLRTIQKYIVQHVEDICRVSARESGKPKVDAVMGEVLTTCEKIRTICEWGEMWLQPEHRPTGPMMMHKSAWVEYVPLGVIVAIAPWNYPFHNSVSKIKFKKMVAERFELCC